MLVLTLALLANVVSAKIQVELEEFTVDPTRDELTLNSISLKKKVVGHKTSLSRALDGNLNTGFTNREEFESISAVDLGAVYDVQEISLYVKNLKEENQTPFKMLISEQFSMSDHRDDYESAVLLLRNFKFNATNQKLSMKLSGFQGQYLSFVDQSPFRFKLPMPSRYQINEIVVRGQKIRDSTVKKIKFKLDWDGVPDKFKQWRFGKNLTNGVPEMWTDKCQQLIPLSLDQACVFGHKTACTAIAGTQGKGKLFVTTSASLLREVYEKGIFPRFKSNLKEWMCPNCDGESWNKFDKNKINILDRKSPYSPKEVKSYLNEGFPTIILIEYRATRRDYQMADELDIGLQGSMLLWYRCELQTDSPSKDLFPVDVIFGLMSGPLEDLLKVDIKYNLQMFAMTTVRKRITDELRDKMRALIKQLHGFGPSIYDQVRDKVGIKFLAYLLMSMRPIFENNLPFPRLPGTSQFPPSTSDVAQRSTVRVTGTTYSGFQRISTGLGVGRGEAFTYRVIEGDIKSWHIIIGSRKDTLFRKDYLNRLPAISHEFPLKSEDMLVSFNTGIIHFYLKQHLAKDGLKPRRIVVEFSNVYRTAVYDRRLPKPWEYWQKTYAETEYPLAEITGEIVNQNVALAYIAKSKQEDIEGIAEILDKWFIINQNVRGTDWYALKGDTFVYDVQISAGWGHSGYPIMGHMPWHLTSIKEVRDIGAWGHCHELGHNYQQGSWKLPNTGEVTNNLLCIYNYNETVSVPTFSYPGRNFEKKQMDDLKNHWKTDDWPPKMYQLNYYLMFGWKFGKGFWANVIYFLNNVEKEKEEFEQLEYLVYVMSKEAGMDFSPYHQLYNMPLGDAVKNATREFGECWMPDRDLTVEVEDKIARIEAEHGRKCTRQAKIIEPIIDLRMDIDLVRKERVKATLQESTGAFPSGYVPTSLDDSSHLLA